MTDKFFPSFKLEDVLNFLNRIVLGEEVCKKQDTIPCYQPEKHLLDKINEYKKENKNQIFITPTCLETELVFYPKKENLCLSCGLIKSRHCVTFCNEQI